MDLENSQFGWSDRRLLLNTDK